MPVILEGLWAACNGKHGIKRGCDRREEAVGSVGRDTSPFFPLDGWTVHKPFRSRPCYPAPESECWRWDWRTAEPLSLTVPWNIRHDPTVSYRSPTKPPEHGLGVCPAVPLMLSFAITVCEGKGEHLLWLGWQNRFCSCRWDAPQWLWMGTWTGDYQLSHVPLQEVGAWISTTEGLCCGAEWGLVLFPGFAQE